MIRMQELKGAAKDLLAYAEKQADVKEAEAYVSSNSLNVYRIAYNSQIPSNGLEEPKSDENYGISLRILFRDRKYGFGSVDSNLEKQGFREAMEKTRESAVLDNDFHSIPEPVKGGAKSVQPKNRFSEEKGIAKAYELLHGSLSALKSSDAGQVNITGEMDFYSTAFVVVNSNNVTASEENSGAFASLTTILEGTEDKAGSTFGSSQELAKLGCPRIGSESAEKALSMRNMQRIESGVYKAVLSESAVAELFYSRFDVALSSLDFHATPFAGAEGKKIGSEMLSVSDEPHLKGLIGSRAFTDEGIPTRKTQLVKDGVFLNYLSNDYYSKKKKEWAKYFPASGFRAGFERAYASEPGIGATNIVVKKGSMTREELFEEIRNGVYIGRLWYTYPVNGYSSPDYTSTIRGDSYIIKNGEIVGALLPNSVRVMDNFFSFTKNIIGIGKKPRAKLSWAEENLVIAPETAVSAIRLKRITNAK